MDLSNPVGLAYAVAALTSAAVAFVSWRRRAQNPSLAAALTLVMVSGGLWSVGLTVEIFTRSETLASIAVLTNSTWASLMVASFLCLALAIANPQWVPRRALVLALLVEPALISAATATNSWHLLVYAGPGAAQLTGSPRWTYGPLYWWHTGFCYLELAISLALIARCWWRASPAFRGQHLALFIGALVPFASNAIFLAGGFSQVMDPTCLSFAVTGTIMWFAIFRQDLMTFSPVARALIIDQIGDAVVVISPLGRILDLNPSAVALLRGMNPEAPTDLIGAKARELVRLGAAGADGQESEVVVELRGGRGEFQVRSSLLVDRRGRSLGTVFVARDVTEANAQSRRLAAAHSQLMRQVETIERLRTDLVELANRDSLTGLHNRRFMVERFGLMVTAAESTGEPLTVALFDVDRFKTINDEHGHLVGDTVLVRIANLMQAISPADALVARWGGEEFFVALPGADAVAGLAFAEDLRRRCELDGVEIAGQTVQATISCGVAAYPTSGTTVEELFQAADITMYQAKEAGRNLVRLHAGLKPTVSPTGLEPGLCVREPLPNPASALRS